MDKSIIKRLQFSQRKFYKQLMIMRRLFADDPTDTNTIGHIKIKSLSKSYRMKHEER